MLEKVENPCSKETESLRDSIKRLWNLWFRTVLGMTSRMEEIRGVCKPNHGLGKTWNGNLLVFSFKMTSVKIRIVSARDWSSSELWPNFHLGDYRCWSCATKLVVRNQHFLYLAGRFMNKVNKCHWNEHWHQLDRSQIGEDSLHCTSKLDIVCRVYHRFSGDTNHSLVLSTHPS